MKAAKNPKTFQTSSEFSQYAKNMTPAEVAEKIYGVSYQKVLADMLRDQTQDTGKNTIERGGDEMEKQIKKYLLDNNHTLVQKVINNNAIDVSGGEFVGGDGKGIFQLGATREVQQRDENTWDFAQVRSKEIEISKDGKVEKIQIIQNLIKDGDLSYPYTAIQIPTIYKTISRKDFYLGKQLAVHQDDRSFIPNLDREQTIPKEFLIVGQRSRRPGEVVGYESGINAWNDRADATDIIRECCKQGMIPMDIDHTIVLCELINDVLGEEYVNFAGHQADSDEEGFADIRKKYQEIDHLLGTEFHVFDTDAKPIDGVQYVMRDYGVYVDKNGKAQGFFRGSFHSDYSALGGVASVHLHCALAFSDSNDGFRPCG